MQVKVCSTSFRVFNKILVLDALSFKAMINYLCTKMILSVYDSSYCLHILSFSPELMVGIFLIKTLLNIKFYIW